VPTKVYTTAGFLSAPRDKRARRSFAYRREGGMRFEPPLAVLAHSASDAELGADSCHAEADSASLIRPSFRTRDAKRGVRRRRTPRDL